MGVRLATIAFESEVAAPRTLEATMPEDAPRPAQAAIRTALWRDLCLVGTVTQNLADHVPVAWGWEKMSKCSVPAGEVSGLLRRFAELRRKAAARTGRDSRLSSSRRSVWTAFESTGCCSRKG